MQVNETRRRPGRTAQLAGIPQPAESGLPVSSCVVKTVIRVRETAEQHVSYRQILQFDRAPKRRRCSDQIPLSLRRSAPTDQLNCAQTHPAMLRAPQNRVPAGTSGPYQESCQPSSYPCRPARWLLAVAPFAHSKRRSTRLFSKTPETRKYFDGRGAMKRSSDMASTEHSLRGPGGHLARPS